MVQASSEQTPRLRMGILCSPHSPGTGQQFGPFPPSPNQANSAWAGSGPSAGPHSPLGLTTALSDSSYRHVTATCCGFLLRRRTRTELGKMLQASLRSFLDQEPGKRDCPSTEGTCPVGSSSGILGSALKISQGKPLSCLKEKGFPMQEGGFCVRALLWTDSTLPKIV